MKYTVTINEEKRSVTVTLANGISGTARCCPTDRFDLNTGIELALERARVASKAKTAPAPAPVPANLSVMELVKALEKALPKDEMVVVGNGDGLTNAHKNWLRSLAGCNGKCYTAEDIEEIEDSAYHDGYDDGYNDGYADGADVVEENELTEDELHELSSKIHELIEEALGI